MVLIMVVVDIIVVTINVEKLKYVDLKYVINELNVVMFVIVNVIENLIITM